MSTTINLIFEKGSKEQKQLSNQVQAFINLNGFKSLTKACAQTGHDYQLIWGQLNGYRICKTKVIEGFIQAIDPKKRIEMMNGKPAITNKHG